MKTKIKSTEESVEDAGLQILESRLISVTVNTRPYVGEEQSKNICNSLSSAYKGLFAQNSK